MNHYMINTDTKTIGKSPHTYWIKKGYVFTGGPPIYGQKLARLKPGDILFVYANRIGIVAIGEVTEKWDGKTYYDEPDIYQNPKENIYKIKVRWLSEMESCPITTSEIRASGGNIIGQTLVKLREDVGIKLLNLRRSLEMKPLPEELDDEKVLYEGAKKQVVVNAYERNVVARSKCIAHYGAKCQVCRMEFKEIYGPEFEGIIHVHHLKQISGIGENYVVDPVNDLKPVCPNCHAAIHSGKEPLEIDYIKEILRNRIIAT